MSKVQVKSTNQALGTRGYRLECRRCANHYRKRYETELVDFFAVHIVARDTWYIIPFPMMEKKWHLSLYPGLSHGYGKRLQPYWEAWHLLKSPDRGSAPSTRNPVPGFLLTIDACAEDKQIG